MTVLVLVPQCKTNAVCNSAEWHIVDFYPMKAQSSLLNSSTGPKLLVVQVGEEHGAGLEVVNINVIQICIT